MPTDQPNPQVRTALSGATLLLVLSVIAASTLDGVQPGLRHLARPTDLDTVPVRHITQSFARAVRELVGSDTHKPVAHLSPPGLRDRVTVRTLVSEFGESALPPQRLLRSALLDLPPPVV